MQKAQNKYNGAGLETDMKQGEKEHRIFTAHLIIFNRMIFNQCDMFFVNCRQQKQNIFAFEVQIVI